MKELVFLPDRDGRDVLSEQTGLVRLSADASGLAALAERLAAPAAAEAAADEAAWRGVLTLALLADVWEGCGASLSVMTIDADTSAFAALVLAARPVQERGRPVRLVLLEKAGKRCLLGMADALCGLRLPASPLRIAGAVPARAAWIDRDAGLIGDPIPHLTERDRAILLERMALMNLSAPQAAAYMEALRRADAEETEAVRAEDPDALERLAVRMEAVHGLTDFGAFSVRRHAYAEGGNPLLRCFTEEDAPGCTGAGEMCTYLWNGVPFARTSSELGLTGTTHPQEAEAIAAITAELAVMSGSSVGWNNRTAAALQGWLDAQRAIGPLLHQARERIEESCRLMRENGRQVQTTITLTWPWDAGSGAVRALLKEMLGDGWMQAAAAPFSDRLTKLTGCQMGDTVLQACCACADGILLPPLSREMAACVALAEPGEGLAADTLRFQHQEDGGITASFLLRGAGEVQLVRSYTVEEIAVIDGEEAPCAAVWPCLPMEKWRAYHVFSRGGVEVAALCGGVWQSAGMGAADRWRCLHTTEYPSCLSLMQDGACLGALPNMLPAFHCEESGDAVAAIDMGSSQTAVAFAFGGELRRLEGQELTRLLVMPQAMEVDEFLQGLTPDSVIPTAVAVTGPGEELFTDGYACRAQSPATLAALDAHSLRTTLKWRSDAESVRARRLLLHQVMLGASLTAMLAGARSIAWRVSIADEMGDEGREALLAMAESLSAAVAQETGLPLTAGQPAVTWAEESAALNTCLRGEESGRGSYVAVDLGGGSTKLHLWVQGQAKPAAGAVLMEGVQTTLLSALYAQPQRLLDDFADCGDERLLQAVVALSAQLSAGQADARQRDKAGLLLDSLMDTLRPMVVQHLNNRFAAQQPTYMQSVLLETEAATLFVAGLMLAQAGDNVMINHRLPEDITVCLSGRGAWLLDTLTPAMRNSLQHLTHAPMRLDHPVRFVTLRAAASPMQSVAQGLAVTRDLMRMSETPLVRTRDSFSELMQRLMLQMVAAFPAHMWLLHEGLFDWQGGLTAAGADTIRRVASRCYGDGEDIPAAVMDFVRVMRETAILPDPMA